MKLSKRIILVSLFAVLAIGLGFIGCSKTTKSSQTVLKILAYGDNSNAEGQNFVRIVTAFEKANPDIKVDFELLYDDAYHSKAKARIASGDIPHVAYFSSDARWGGSWREAGQLVDHTPYLNKAHYNIDAFPLQDGKREYVPLGTTNDCTVLFANKALLDELGLAMPKTYADMVAMVPVAKAKGIQVLAVGGAADWVWGSCVMSAIISRTTGLLDAPEQILAGKKKVTDADVVAALDFLTTMVKDGVITSNAVLVDTQGAVSDFSTKKALFLLGGQWEAGGIVPEIAKDTKLMSFPTIPGEKASAALSSAGAISVGYGFTKKAVEDGVVEAAVKFLDYFNNDAEVIQRLRDGAIVAPVTKAAIPNDMPAIINEKVAYGAAGYPSAQVIDSYIQGDPNDLLNAGMQQIVAGKATAAEIAAKVQAALNK
ncbi:MAG TPA: extracellular solute-binding protein [Treponemataceae bacterium]|nr:extracellular solute-binding protein [Treponemataceae bacterium]